MAKLTHDEQFLIALGKRLREIRGGRSWTLEETEEHGWPSWRHLQMVETGKNVTILTIYKLAKLYKISISKIFKGL
jgi:transcriptional regulator with XRE-family HTH domain